MLTFVGLGLYDEQSITVEGQQVLRDADRVYAEFYTSRLVGATVEDLEAYHDVAIEVRDRSGVEQAPDEILAAAETASVAFLTAGDPMVSTTHVDLRLRAADRGIDTRIVHGTTAQSAASGLTGLQNYRFGKATTLPFPDSHGGEGVPQSVIGTIDANRDRGLHTLVYLDIKADQEAYMQADQAAELLATQYEDTLGVAVARAGSPAPVVRADRLEALAGMTFGEPLHLLVLPGELHHIEADALGTFGDAPSELLPVE
ncbi:MAG: diphthine synthase [Halobacteriales archaeon]|nr:diphthine synthase [Halobacteriales archaeon]